MKRWTPHGPNQRVIKKNFLRFENTFNFGFIGFLTVFVVFINLPALIIVLLSILVFLFGVGDKTWLNSISASQ